MMVFCKKALRTYWFYVCCVGMLALFLAAATVWNGLSLWVWLRLLFYQVFCMLLPGYATVSLLRIPRKSRIATLAFSYAAGYCLGILTYLVCIPLSLITDAWMWGIPVLQYALTGFGLTFAVLRLRRDLKQEAIAAPTAWKEALPFLLVWLGVFLLYFLFYGLPNRILGNGSDQAYYHDTLYWLGNAISLSRGFPPESLRGAGYIIKYHYFSGMQLVSMEKALGISIPTLGLVYSYLQSSLLICGGYYCLFSAFFRKKWKVIWGILLLVFSMGMYEQTSIHYVSHILLAPFGYDYAIGLLAFALLLLYALHRKTIPFGRGCMLYLVLFALCLGTKAPVGVILLGFEGLLCLRWLFSRTIGYKWYKVVAFGAASLILFAAVYLLFMANAAAWFKTTDATAAAANATVSTAESASRQGLLSWAGTARYATVLQYADTVSAPSWLSPFIWLGTLLQFVFYINMAIMLPALWRLLRMLCRPRHTEDLQWFLATVVAVGIGITLFISMVGFSQVYFADAILPFAILLAFYRPSQMPPQKRALTWVRYGTAALLTGVCCFQAWQASLPTLRDSIAIMQHESLTYAEVDGIRNSNLVTPAEAEGYEWIKQNTEQDAVLVTNATLYLANPLMTNVFCERAIYVESIATPSVSRPVAEERSKKIAEFMYGIAPDHTALQESGVDYVILLKRFQHGYERTQALELVFANDGIEVYKMQ